MESGTLSEEEFSTFGKEVVLFLHITTKIQGRKDDDLLSKVGGKGFPHLIAMDATGKVLGSPAGRSVEKFRAHMKLVKEYGDLKAKADKGDATAKIDFFIAALKMGDFKTLEEAKKYGATLKKPSKEQLAAIDSLYAGFEVQTMAEPLRGVRDAAKAKEMQIELGKKYAAMDKAGRVPFKNEDFGLFYSVILMYAEDAKDIPLFEKSLKAIKDKFGEDINQRFVDEKESTLEKMKEEKAGGGDKK